MCLGTRPYTVCDINTGLLDVTSTDLILLTEAIPSLDPGLCPQNHVRKWPGDEARLYLPSTWHYTHLPFRDSVSDGQSS